MAWPCSPNIETALNGTAPPVVEDAFNAGDIVNIGSVSSFRPQPNNAAYVAAKHGVIGLTKVASLENAPMGIRVNAVCPGAIDTPMLRGALETSAPPRPSSRPS